MPQKWKLNYKYLLGTSFIKEKIKLKAKIARWQMVREVFSDNNVEIATFIGIIWAFPGMIVLKCQQEVGTNLFRESFPQKMEPHISRFSKNGRE